MIIDIISISIAGFAILFSVLSFFVNYKESIRPVFIFYNPGMTEGNKDWSWYMENVGSGTAINIVLMTGDINLKWNEDITTGLSGLPSGQSIKLDWIQHPGSLYANYTDFGKKKYSTLCVNSENTIKKRRYRFKSLPVKKHQYQLFHKN